MFELHHFLFVCFRRHPHTPICEWIYCVITIVNLFMILSSLCFLKSYYSIDSHYPEIYQFWNMLDTLSYPPSLFLIYCPLFQTSRFCNMVCSAIILSWDCFLLQIFFFLCIYTIIIQYSLAREYRLTRRSNIDISVQILLWSRSNRNPESVYVM